MRQKYSTIKIQFFSPNVTRLQSERATSVFPCNMVVVFPKKPPFANDCANFGQKMLRRDFHKLSKWY